MIFKRKKRGESDWWKGLKEAEKLIGEGFSREGNKWSAWTNDESYVVVVPSRKTEYRDGMDDYLEHRALNKEIYND